MTVLKGKYPIVQFGAGVHVVNFGSPHSYTFDNGKVLDACSEYVSKQMMLEPDHTNVAHIIIDTADSRLKLSIPKDKIDNWREYVLSKHPEYDGCKMWLDVFINYQIPSIIEDDIIALAEKDMINIILVPYPILNAWEYETKVQKEIADNLLLTQLDSSAIDRFTDVWQFALLKMRTCHLKDRITKISYYDRFCASSLMMDTNKADRKLLRLARNGN